MRERLIYSITLPPLVRTHLQRLAKRAGHENMSRMVEFLIEREYDRQKKARERQREGAA